MRIVLAAALIATPALAAEKTAQPRTVIHFAANGGLRDWQKDRDDPSALFVRDRTEHWYRVRLSGPCARRASLDAMVYTTANNGDFDTFSTVSFPRTLPYARCRVEAISPSAPPPQVKRPKR